MTLLRTSIQIGCLVLFAFIAAGCKFSGESDVTSQNATASQNPAPQVPTNNDNTTSQNAEVLAQKEDRGSDAELPTYSSSPEALPPPISSRGLTHEVMKNVDLHPDDLLDYRIRTIRGTLLRRYKSSPPLFDDKRSFILNIDSAVIGLNMDTLSNLMNNYVFAYAGAPLKDFQFSVDGNEIKATGKVHKLVDLPFEVRGELSATPEGKIRIHPTSVKAEDLPIKGFLHLFGVELDDVVKAREARGLKFDGDDLIVDPERGGPPPMIRGRVTAVQIVGDEVVMVFGGGKNLSEKQIATLANSRSGGNYLYYRGGVLRFGKMTMTNSDIKIVDANPKDPLDFSVDHFNQQMVAGYSKITPRGGLVAHVPDYYRLRRIAPTRKPRQRKAKSLRQSANRAILPE
jgi:hypothetical protein